MSRRNHHANKAARRIERADRKARAVKTVPFCGVMVTRGLVLQHRYAAIHDQPFSLSVASVLIVGLTGGSREP